MPSKVWYQFAEQNFFLRETRLHEDSNTKESNICIGSVVDLSIGFRVDAAVDKR